MSLLIHESILCDALLVICNHKFSIDEVIRRLSVSEKSENHGDPVIVYLGQAIETSIIEVIPSIL